MLLNRKNNCSQPRQPQPGSSPHLHLPQGFGAGGRRGRLPARGPEEHVLLLPVLITRQELLLLCVEQPHHVPLPKAGSRVSRGSAQQGPSCRQPQLCLSPLWGCRPCCRSISWRARFSSWCCSSLSWPRRRTQTISPTVLCLYKILPWATLIFQIFFTRTLQAWLHCSREGKSFLYLLQNR